MSYFRENNKIMELLNKEAACGKVTNILDKLKLDDNSFAVIFETKDGPVYGAIIIDNKVDESGGTGHLTAASLIKDRLIHKGVNTYG